MSRKTKTRFNLLQGERSAPVFRGAPRPKTWDELTQGEKNQWHSKAHRWMPILSSLFSPWKPGLTYAGSESAILTLVHEGMTRNIGLVSLATEHFDGE